MSSSDAKTSFLEERSSLFSLMPCHATFFPRPVMWVGMYLANIKTDERTVCEWLGVGKRHWLREARSLDFQAC